MWRFRATRAFRGGGGCRERVSRVRRSRPREPAVLKREIVLPPEAYPPDAVADRGGRWSPRFSSAPRPRSRSPTATWASAGRSTRAGRPSRRARSSTASTRRGRSSTPRRPTGWRAVRPDDRQRPRRHGPRAVRRRRAAVPADRPPRSDYARACSTCAPARCAASSCGRPPAGKHVTVRSCRLVSFEHRHVVAISYEVTVDHPAPVAIVSQVVNRRTRPDHDPPAAAISRPAARPALRPPRARTPHRRGRRDGRILLGYETANSGMTLAVGVEHVVETPAPHRADTTVAPTSARWCSPPSASRASPSASSSTSPTRRRRAPARSDLVARCHRTLDRAGEAGSTRC